LVLAATILASSLAFIDGSVVNVGLPAIGRSFDGSASDLQWVVNGYSLPLSALLLLGGAAGTARGRAIGIWAAVGAVTVAAGPVLGGFLIAIFFVNIPLAVAAIALLLGFVSDPVANTKAVPLDLLGGLLATASLGLMTWGLTVGSGAGGWTTPAVITLGGGALLLLAFLGVEARSGDSTMMPLAMFGSPTFLGLTIVTFLLYGARYSRRRMTSLSAFVFIGDGKALA
jgi:MFS family permease